MALTVSLYLDWCGPIHLPFTILSLTIFSRTGTNGLHLKRWCKRSKGSWDPMKDEIPLLMKCSTAVCTNEVCDIILDFGIRALKISLICITVFLSITISAMLAIRRVTITLPNSLWPNAVSFLKALSTLGQEQIDPIAYTIITFPNLCILRLNNYLSFFHCIFLCREGSLTWRQHRMNPQPHEITTLLHIRGCTLSKGLAIKISCCVTINKSKHVVLLL